MKRRGLAIVIILVMTLLIPLISAQSPQVSILEEIRNVLISILETLQNSISTKLQTIADKNATINVNVESPQITLNPNITLPQRECQTDRFNQVEHNLDFGGSFGCCGFHDVSKPFQLPTNIPYRNVTALSGRIVGECTHSDSNCRFKINEIDCGIIIRNQRGIYEFSENCINAIVSGANNLTISVPSNGNGFIESYYIESEIISSNC